MSDGRDIWTLRRVQACAIRAQRKSEAYLEQVDSWLERYETVQATLEGRQAIGSVFVLTLGCIRNTLESLQSSVLLLQRNSAFVDTEESAMTNSGCRRE